MYLECQIELHRHLQMALHIYGGCIGTGNNFLFGVKAVFSRQPILQMVMLL